jgi:hypothetical protein
MTILDPAFIAALAALLSSFLDLGAAPRAE